MFKKERQVPDTVEVVIGSKATFAGALRCDGGILVEGVVEDGKLETPGNVAITQTARVQGDIKAQVVSISGAFKGKIDAGRVEIVKGGKLFGDAHVDSFLLEEGGFFSGGLFMRGEAPEDPFVPPRPEKEVPVEQDG